ncbi:hypothetical protein SAMN04488020_10384 [Palleronia marisminoris]|uniref:Uncharacterized protein n=1 Tax=Palleronia marisminoris TaxID=315423 RepID=A0A1Y5S762_9RHOB|nr:hypothetical protein [Palleronia marisminoris]SFG64738.1 hypothetical protein SAMN04488020_10384 [Palleronia marisminoris]SLN33489.1 hypothetical protein PAM7066_01364 [Palleronia marisminoris]
MTKTFSVTVYPEPLSGEYLTVSDALNQVLDMIEALERSESIEGSDRKIVWRLTEAHTNSPPFTLVAEPYPVRPDMSVAMEAGRVSGILSKDVGNLLNGQVGGVVFDALPALKRIIGRNTKHIARTEVLISGKEAFIIRPQNARMAMAAIERAEIAERESAPDWTRTEFGTVEGEISGLTRWNGKPALDIIERLSEKKFTCVLSDELSEKVGPEHKWNEVWDGRRVHITGALYYNADGDLKRADASEFEEVPWTDVSVNDLKSLDVLGEKTMQEHLDEIRGEAFG